MTIHDSSRPGAAPGHDHGPCIQGALERAAVLCARRGARLTPLRRRVLELVWQGHTAVKAYDLLGRLGAEPGTAKPPIVYRTLDFLLAHGLIHKLESVNAFVGCPNPGERHDGQFLICDHCGEVRELEVPAIEAGLGAAAAAAGFQVAQKTVEARGACLLCRQAAT